MCRPKLRKEKGNECAWIRWVIGMGHCTVKTMQIFHISTLYSLSISVEKYFHVFHFSSGFLSTMSCFENCPCMNKTTICPESAFACHSPKHWHQHFMLRFPNWNSINWILHLRLIIVIISFDVNAGILCLNCIWTLFQFARKKAGPGRSVCLC